MSLARIPDLVGMAVFARVVEAGSFTAAARALGISRSAVSKHIARLEDRLGARLLNRTTRRLSLTEVGAAYRDRAVELLSGAEEAELAVARMHATPYGTLRINAPVSFGIAWLGPAIAAFQTGWPALRINLELTDRYVDVVEEGYDLAIRIGPLADSSLIARRLASSHLVICGASSWLARHGEPLTPGDLTGHNCLRYSYLRSGRDEWRLTGPDGPVTVPVSGNLTTNNGEVHLAAVLRGQGLAMLPTFIAGPDIRAGRLRALLTDHVVDQGVYAVYPHSRHLSAKVRLFVDFLGARYGRYPEWEKGLDFLAA